MNDESSTPDPTAVAVAVPEQPTVKPESAATPKEASAPEAALAPRI